MKRCHSTIPVALCFIGAALLSACGNADSPTVKFDVGDSYIDAPENAAHGPFVEPRIKLLVDELLPVKHTTTVGAGQLGRARLKGWDRQVTLLMADGAKVSEGVDIVPQDKPWTEDDVVVTHYRFSRPGDYVISELFTDKSGNSIRFTRSVDVSAVTNVAEARRRGVPIPEMLFSSPLREHFAGDQAYEFTGSGCPDEFSYVWAVTDAAHKVVSAATGSKFTWETAALGKFTLTLACDRKKIAGIPDYRSNAKATRLLSVTWQDTLQPEIVFPRANSTLAAGLPFDFSGQCPPRRWARVMPTVIVRRKEDFSGAQDVTNNPRIVSTANVQIASKLDRSKRLPMTASVTIVEPGDYEFTLACEGPGELLSTPVAVSFYNPIVQASDDAVAAPIDTRFFAEITSPVINSTLCGRPASKMLSHRGIYFAVVCKESKVGKTGRIDDPKVVEGDVEWTIRGADGKFYAPPRQTDREFTFSLSKRQTYDVSVKCSYTNKRGLLNVSTARLVLDVVGDVIPTASPQPAADEKNRASDYVPPPPVAPWLPETELDVGKRLAAVAEQVRELKATSTEQCSKTLEMFAGMRSELNALQAQMGPILELLKQKCGPLPESWQLPPAACSKSVEGDQ